jgi:hypothetical protein
VCGYKSSPQLEFTISFVFRTGALLERYNSYETNLDPLIKQLFWSVLIKCPTAFACCVVLPACHAACVCVESVFTASRSVKIASYK